ncbi:MAG: hypothetical protein WCW77_02260 [Patescibacteria group bacterium]|jgi:tetratricopeptide (TPR) repeat protein
MNKKTIILIGLALVIIAAGAFAYFYKFKPAESEMALGGLKKDHPELSALADDVITEQEKMKKDPGNVINYNSLGMAWKTLAEKAHDIKLENYKEYYNEALKVYDKGIEVSQRKNTVLIVNAGNMAKYLENYPLAEEYYKEAISVSPGDATYYIYLAELYEYQMKKSKDDIIGIYEQGKKRILNPDFLQARIDEYLGRTK